MGRLLSLSAGGFAVVALLMPSTLSAQSVQLTQFGGGDFNLPYHVTGDPSDSSRVFVVEGAGKIRLVENGATQATDFLDITGEVCSPDDGCEFDSGLFSMALAPDYATSGLFYVAFTRAAATPGVLLVIKEFQRNATNSDLANPASGRDVLVIPILNAPSHNGGQLQFGPDDLLYLSTGDGGNAAANSQNLASRLGKILRIDPAGDGPGEYSIPPGNPFADGAGDNADEIYSYGLRNPWRFSFDRITGDMTIGDVGQNISEEVDFVPNGDGNGANFGWNCFEGSAVRSTSGDCDPPLTNHTPPVFEYANPPDGPASITGGYVVRDPGLPALLGRYVYADSSGALGNMIRCVTLFPGGSSGDSPTGLSASNVVSFGEDAAGNVYVASADGPVYRIDPAAGSPPCGAGGGEGTAAAAAADTAPSGLSVDLSRGRRAADSGEVTLIVSCSEQCSLTAGGKIVLPGKDIGLDPAAAALVPGAAGAIGLELSGKELKLLRGKLRSDAKAKAKVDVTATDQAGNKASQQGEAKQKR